MKTHSILRLDVPRRSWRTKLLTARKHLKTTARWEMKMTDWTPTKIVKRRDE